MRGESDAYHLVNLFKGASLNLRQIEVDPKTTNGAGSSPDVTVSHPPI